MSNVHKSLHDLEKIDNQYDAMLNNKKDKKIVKTTSLAKLKSVITQNLPMETEVDSKNDKNPGLKQGQGPPATSLKFLKPKDVISNDDACDDMSQKLSSSANSDNPNKQIKISVSMRIIDSN